MVLHQLLQDQTESTTPIKLHPQQLLEVHSAGSPAYTLFMYADAFKMLIDHAKQYRYKDESRLVRSYG